MAGKRKKVEPLGEEVPSVRLGSLTFSDGKRYELGPKDKLVIVGPNNAGKSLALREITATFHATPNRPNLDLRCVVSTSVQVTSDEVGLKRYLDRNAEHTGDVYVLGSDEVSGAYLKWFGAPSMGPLAALFVRHVTTENRLRASQEVDSIGPGDRSKQPQHQLYDSEALMAHVCGLFRAAFGESLVIDYRGGKKVPIHVGQPPTMGKQEDRVSDTYVAKVRALPKLAEQGDGMRSFAGILFEAIVSKHAVTLVDEPEAFLHPPQMRRLARTLVDEIPDQLLVSTHSSDILRGFLDSGSRDVRILRIQRNGNANETQEMPPSEVSKLWENPDLKYSNALEAIFHEQCVLCEDDSDCRFYEALFDRVASGKSKSSWRDTVFVPCGGKHSLSKMATALHNLGVRCRVAADIDLLAEEDNLASLVSSLGGSWDSMRPDWVVMNNDVRKGVKPLSPAEIRLTIKAQLDGDQDAAVPKSEIAKILKRDSPWSIVKQNGKAAIPRGNASEAFGRLDLALREVGIFVVPVGEVEGFAPNVGLHGTSFVNKALKEIPLSSPQLAEARKFVADVCS